MLQTEEGQQGPGIKERLLITISQTEGNTRYSRCRLDQDYFFDLMAGCEPTSKVHTATYCDRV